MTTDPITSEYSHTQTAPLCLIPYASALLCCAVGLGVGETAGVYLAVAVGGVLALFGTAIHHLKVEDRSDRLAVRLGPLPMMRTAVNYADIVTVEAGRALLLDGWGVPTVSEAAVCEPSGAGPARRPSPERRAADRY